MSTQLRLVETLEPAVPVAAPSAGASRHTRTRATSRRGDAPASRPSSRTRAGRAARWGDWQLDTRTRRVGRAGVAAARAALEQAATAPEREQDQPVHHGDRRRIAS